MGRLRSFPPPALGQVSLDLDVLEYGAFPRTDLSGPRSHARYSLLEGHGRRAAEDRTRLLVAGIRVHHFVPSRQVRDPRRHAERPSHDLDEMIDGVRSV